MRLPNQIAFVVLATYTVNATPKVGLGNIKFCYDENLSGKCTYPMDVSMAVGCRAPEDDDKKYGDKHSSIAVRTLPLCIPCTTNLLTGPDCW